MTTQQTKDFFILATILITAVFLLVAQFALNLNIQFANDMAMLSVITAVAIAIERVIEIFWTLVGLTKGAWWPLGQVTTQINSLVDNVDALVKPVYDAANLAIDKMAAANQWTQEYIQSAKDELVALQQNLGWIKNLAPDAQRVNLISAQAFQNVSYLLQKYPDIYQTAMAANQAVTGLTDLVATFKENPGRRLISIYLGMLAGLAIAGLGGLDVFHASGSALPTIAPGLFPYLGVALTGVIVGLGATPTHEVIRTLQEMKAGRKLDNTPLPSGAQSNFATFQLRGK